jgi:DNA ligase-1
MLIALSRAFLLSRPPGADFPLKSQEELGKLKKDALAEVWAKAEETVKACFAKRPNYNDLIPALLEVGVCDELLIRCGLALHVPLLPMLGSITRDLSEMLTKLQGRAFSCEYKYDGQRAQIHCDAQGKVSIFSRHLELMTDKYPDLVALIPKVSGDGVSSFIMEGEVVAVDQESGELKTFQTLANRARKDVAIGSVKVSVCLFAFDLMYLNGEPLLDRPFRERRELLRSLFTEVPNKFTWVKSIDSTSQDSEMILDFFKSATDSKCEGLMVKILDNLPNPKLKEEVEEDAVTLQPTANSSKGVKKSDNEKEPKKSRRKALLSTYEPDKRLESWLKVKKDYSTTFDTLDLIPIAGWHGQGRKAKFWSPILLAVRNEETGSLEAVCKCISGFTDAFYKANKEYYEEGGEHVLGGKPAYVEYEGGYPDVWFEPQEVWEM